MQWFHTTQGFLNPMPDVTYDVCLCNSIQQQCLVNQKLALTLHHPILFHAFQGYVFFPFTISQNILQLLKN